MAEEMLELGQIIKDEPLFSAPEGDYRFFVKDWKITNYNPRKEDSKIPACKQASVTLLIPYKDEEGNVVFGQKVEQFKLLVRLQFVITRFFIGCGIGDTGDKFKLDFDQCIGRTGVCKVQQEIGSNGNVYSKIAEFYHPRVAPKVTMNDDIPFEPQRQQQQPEQQPQQQGGGYVGYGYGYGNPGY